MDQPPLQKVACPSCGAPLLFGPHDGKTTRCQFCNAVVERPARPSRPVQKPTFASPPPPAHPAAAVAPPSSTFFGCAILLSILVAAGLILLVVFLAGSQTIFSKPALSVNSPIALLPTGQTTAPDFISVAYDSSAGTDLLVRLSPANRRVVWRGKTFKDLSAIRAIAAGEDRFFTAEGDELHAYSAADGSPLWQAKLSDQLGYCDGCLSVGGDRVIALTQDYVIQAFDAGTGDPAWRRRMDGYTAGFSIADGAVWVIDKADDAYGLLLLSLGDGTVQRQIVPECRREDGLWSNGVNASSKFVLDPVPSVASPDRSIYLLYAWSPSCVERWSESTGAMVWQTGDKDGYSPSEDYATLVTADTLFFSTEGNLWAADKATGKIRALAQGGDYYLVPLALEQGTLIVRTERRRGSRQYGLRGMDPAQGEILWQYTIDKGAPLDPPDSIAGLVDSDQSAWTWRMADGPMVLINFQADPNQIVFQTINPKDGSIADGKTIALGGSSDFYPPPTVVAWQDPLVWVIAERKLLAIDIVSMSVKYSFP
jgi:outer membrane protein assembly factor BamB